MKEWVPAFPWDCKGCLNFSAICIAARRSGKTYMLNYLIRTTFKKRYDAIYIFTTPINIMDYMILGGIPKKNIYTNNSTKKIEQIMKHNAGKKNPLNILVIFDDTISRKQKYDEHLLNLYVKGRHYNVSVIYATQSATLVDNMWKENSDLIFIWRPRIFKYKKYIVDNILLGSLDIDFDTESAERRHYKRILQKVTKEKHRALVVDLANFELFTYKCPKYA